ncbi:MAG TPA: nicotinate-nucleotide adenylyltransferase [Spirochaetota bacterium]|nr:nicotinate-nucleotide adenylyltransferase [Spirochaetota bacterium]HOM39047.1 nicotinate-nucleotide adenylyltransferase [Spirochaetota bacterium]HPQ49900.1 nicotinate-nucleotide adenylyltransferase [Spirochaetota bacterium]
MYKIGILGGSFNPIHIGHLIIANEAINRLKLDKVFFIPTMNPFKNIDILPLHRYNMTKLATFDNHMFEVLDIEIKNNKPSYTIDTVNYLFSNYKDTEFFFISGSDIVDNFEKWKDYKELGNMLSFIIYKREHYNIDKIKSFYNIVRDCILIDGPLINISSSMLRQYIKNGYNIKYFVTDYVLEYIKENKLYI